MSEAKAEDVIDHLDEGCSLRTTSRLTKAAKATVARLLKVSGRHAQRFHHQEVQDFPLRILVHDANIQDRDGIAPLLAGIKKRYPRLRLVWVDAGYQGPRVQETAKREKLRIDVVKRPRGKGFIVVPRRWVGERSFAWLEAARRLSRHFEINDKSEEAWIAMRFVKIATKRLT